MIHGEVGNIQRVSGETPQAEGKFDRCIGCHYARHGLVCWTTEAGCLREDLKSIEVKNRIRWKLSQFRKALKK